MSSKLGLYLRTARGLTPHQIESRIRRMAGLNTPLHGAKPGERSRGFLSRLAVVPELDFDPVFLARFDCEEILADRLTLLHHAEDVDWDHSWMDPHLSHLWSFNLHYHEYLIPLLKMSLDGCESRYLDKAKEIIDSWISSCPRSSGGDAWHPYTISVRVANWLAFVAEGGERVSSDRKFMKALDASLHEQYAYLCCHLETDLMANHYFENLKALVLLACYFGDEQVLDSSLDLLEKQVSEQVLADGMHFELSPMYHKIVLEALLRVIAALRATGVDCSKLEDAARRMSDALYSMESGVNRTPLFNDGGDNVAKSRDALISCVGRLLGHTPTASSNLNVSGYQIIERDCFVGKVKLIFDTGMPGPRCAPGHSHCDALSFELFIDGVPAVVNSGTYAYQDPLRSWFRSSEAHNGIWREGVEQSEMWGEHRMARSATVRLLNRVDLEDFTELTAELTDFHGGRIARTVCLDGTELRLYDTIIEGGGSLNAVLHFPSSGGTPYAPEFGLISRATSFKVTSADGSHRIRIPLASLAGGKPVVSVSHGEGDDGE